jgi:transposase-like protein
MICPRVADSNPIRATTPCCRAHKLGNTLNHLPEKQKEQVKSLMRAAWKMETKAGMARIRKLAEWLEREYPSAADSLREGLEECLKINRLGVPPSLQALPGDDQHH